MKRIVLSATVAALMAVMFALAGTAGASHMGAADSARGKGVIESVSGFSFEAHNFGAVEDDAHGQMELLGTLVGSFKAEVTCLDVVGNQATIVGRITEKGASNPEQTLIFIVEDNGKGGTTPDRFAFQFLTTPPPDECTHVPGALSPLTKGDIEVRDR